MKITQFFATVGVLAVSFGVSACQNVQESSSVEQPLQRSMVAGVGDTVLKVNQYKSLPNAFGKADLFGRTTASGMVTVQYAGVQGSKALFIRSGIAIETNETTMTRTPLIVPTQQTTTISGQVGSRPIYGQATTNGLAVIQEAQPQGYSMQQPSMQIAVDLKSNPTLRVGDRLLVIEGATATALSYHVE